MQDDFEWPQEWSSYTDLTVILNKFFSIMVKISKKLIYKRKKKIKCNPEGETRLYTRNIDDKKNANDSLRYYLI